MLTWYMTLLTALSDNFGDQLFHLYHRFIPAALAIFISVYKQLQ